MKRNMTIRYILAFAALVSAAVLCMAQPGTPPSPDWYQESYYDQWPGFFSDSWLDLNSGPVTTFPSGEPYSSGFSSQVGDGAPTTSSPYAGLQPSTPPQPYSGGMISSLGEGQALTETEVRMLPGGASLLLSAPSSTSPGSATPGSATFGSTTPGAMAPLSGGLDPTTGTSTSYSYSTGYSTSYSTGYSTGYAPLRQWIYYNRMWTYGPASVYYGQRANTIIYNNMPQNIWSYEVYPNGYVSWSYWGYWYPGYHHAWFGGDMRGWHQIAIYGSRTGWSNVIWVYVV